MYHRYLSDGERKETVSRTQERTQQLLMLDLYVLGCISVNRCNFRRFCRFILSCPNKIVKMRKRSKCFLSEKLRLNITQADRYYLLRERT